MSSAIEGLQRLIDDYVGSTDGIQVLEAGCGSMSKVNLGKNVRMVGIDISEKQLDRNEVLHEKILGDVHTYPLPRRSFDIIICWDVLEHLENPRKALENFFNACKPNGLIILAFPNLFSLKGVLTKFTPHLVHVWYYRYLLGMKDAGKDDQPPFVTRFRLAMTYPAIRQLAISANATVAYFAFRESPDMRFIRDKYWFINVLLKTTSFISRNLTLGAVDLINSDCIMVLRAGPAN